MMHRRMNNMIMSGYVLVVILLMAGCGEQKSVEQAGTFGEGISLTEQSLDLDDVVVTIPTNVHDNSIDENGLDELIELESENDDPGANQLVSSPQVSKKDESIIPTPVPTALPSSKPANQDSKQQKPLPSTQVVTSKLSSDHIEPKLTTAPTKEPIKLNSEQKKETTKSKYQSISWNGFFDNEEQNTPSDDFWDLSEAKKNVQIKGFMGEILSLDNNWFLLIPEPGAECPFDNGDETYWNKIMIVYVKDGTKLRYTSKPLQITGRLDVGVKVDESGYKTMFRIYDANVEEIKE